MAYLRHVAAVMTVLGLLSFPARPPVQSALSHVADRTCAPGIGKRVPVMFVHGFTETQKIWTDRGDGSLYSAVSHLSNVYPVTFDYTEHAEKWVTNEAIGPALARRIACIAKYSHDAGGPGKVVVVAHSMGGLATRYAATWRDPATNGQPAKGGIALLITLGTPSLGSFIQPYLQAWCEGMNRMPGSSPRPCDGFWNLRNSTKEGAVALQPGSDALRQLPPMPRDIPVLAIASVFKVLSFQLFKMRINIEMESDTLVTSDSALHGASRVGEFGGKYIAACDVLSLSGQIGWQCLHGEQPWNSDIQARVLSEISRYVQMVTLAPYVGKWFIHGSELTIRVDGSAEMVWNVGPCTLEDAEMCSGHALIRFYVSDARLVGVYRRVQYSSTDGKRIPAGFERPREPYVGMRLGPLRLISAGLLFDTDPPEYGNPYYCRREPVRYNDARCGA